MISYKLLIEGYVGMESGEAGNTRYHLNCDNMFPSFILCQFEVGESSTLLPLINVG